MSLSHHEIEFTLKHNNKPIYNLKRANQKKRVVEVLGKSIDKKISECIYAGILTDTGSFKFSMSPKVHKIVSDLMS